MKSPQSGVPAEGRPGSTRRRLAKRCFGPAG
jgi:hypothetical protein